MPTTNDDFEAERCYGFHTCSECGNPTLCDTFKDTCPWRIAEREAMDGTIAGAVCLDCISIALSCVQFWGDEDLGR